MKKNNKTLKPKLKSNIQVFKLFYWLSSPRDVFGLYVSLVNVSMVHFKACDQTLKDFKRIEESIFGEINPYRLHKTRTADNSNLFTFFVECGAYLTSSFPLRWEFGSVCTHFMMYKCVMGCIKFKKTKI